MLKDALLSELKHEAENTRKLLERVPQEHFAWKPHEKSYCLRDLAQHIANIPIWAVYTLQQDELDFDNPPFGEVKRAETADELLRFFNSRIEAATEVFNNTSDEVFNKLWTMRKGSEVFFTMPKIAVVRNFVMNHIVHHRGQLSVYLRLLNIPVPGVYGPSADEK